MVREGNVVVRMMRKAIVSLGMVGVACGGGLRRCLRETQCACACWAC